MNWSSLVSGSVPVSMIAFGWMVQPWVLLARATRQSEGRVQAELMVRSSTSTVIDVLEVSPSPLICDQRVIERGHRPQS